MIIDIRGTHGAGKSSLVRALMKGADAVADVPDERRAVDENGGEGRRSRPRTPPILGYVAQFGGPYGTRVGIVGRYTTDCGGCDTVKTQDEVTTRVAEFGVAYDHVVYEGAVVTTIWGRYRDLARLCGGEFAFAFLDTPLDECVRRVNARRAAQGKDPLIDPGNIAAKFEVARRIRANALAGGFRVVDLDHRNPLPGLRAVLDV